MGLLPELEIPDVARRPDSLGHIVEPGKQSRLTAAAKTVLPRVILCNINVDRRLCAV